jgi:microcin C transport system substrate-binding protein
MRQRQHRFFFVLLAVTLFMASSLSADEQPTSAVAMHGVPKYGAAFLHFDYTNPDAPKGGTLKLSVIGTFDTLHPFLVRGQPPLGVGTGYMSLVYETLMARSWDEPFSLYGLIAQSIQIASDRSSIVFNLNPKAHWQDGEPISADDVLFSFENLRDHGRPNHRTYYKKVAQAEKLGPGRVKFTFKPNPDGSIDREMPLIMALMPVLPQHDFRDRPFESPGWRIPIGSGPYKITRLDRGRSITYMHDSHYWGADVPAQKGLYNFDQISVDYYRDDSMTLQAFKAGQFDLRRETDAAKWATAYDFPAVKDGRVRLESFVHHRTEATTGFVLNTRREVFKDPLLRAALEYTFDFDWINRNLFHGQYHRTESFFPNSELAAPPLPDEKERKILAPFRTQLPADILTTALSLPKTNGSEIAFRANLLTADAMLRKAGYVMRADQLFTPAGHAVTFEILLSDPVEEKIALTWVRALKRLGIAAHVHTVDSAQFQARLATFDYDATVGKWINSLSPGNEQIFFWGSAAAHQQGSRNYPGIADPVVDALAALIPTTTTRDDLIATTHALDRVLMAGHYVIPFYYLGADDIAYWTQHLRHPALPPLYGTILESWWAQ